VGADVRHVRKGELVIAPFAFRDGTCPHCRHGITSACVAGGFYPSNGDGGQGEAVRVPLADGSLVQVPGSGHSDEMLASLLTLSDVDPGRVLDYETDLEGIADAYAAMDDRRAIKSLVRIGGA
jgi:threonine dehydrogenase-like Zn-dependent dehydrogenase